jgi:hypothetical protein
MDLLGLLDAVRKDGDEAEYTNAECVWLIGKPIVTTARRRTGQITAIGIRRRATIKQERLDAVSKIRLHQSKGCLSARLFAID